MKKTAYVKKPSNCLDKINRKKKKKEKSKICNMVCIN